MRILSLIENTSASNKLHSEHGLSLYIEKDDNHYLLDTGASAKLIDNARKMRVPLNLVKVIAISHNHIDHTGGLEAVMAKAPEAKIYAKLNCINDFYRKIGLFQFPISQLTGIISKNPERFVLYNTFQQIGDGFFMMSNEVDDRHFFCHDKSLTMKSGEEYIPDEFTHEAFGVIFPEEDVKKGCVILSPCSHNGIVNIIRTVKQTWQESPILAVIGGFHMIKTTPKSINCTEEYLVETAKALQSLDVGTIYTCHCTGLKAYGIMKAIMGDQLQYLQTGEELQF